MRTHASKHATRAGFSLIEVLVYVAVLVIATSAVVAALLSLGDSYSQLRAAQSLQRSAVSALERVVREVRLADAVDQGASVLGVHPGVLVLQREDESGTQTTEFSLADGALQVTENGVPAGALTTQHVSVSNVVFWFVPGTVSDGVRTELTLRATSGPTTLERTFYSFAVIRR